MQKCSGSVPPSSLRASGDGDRACQLLLWHSADCLLPTRLVECLKDGKGDSGHVQGGARAWSVSFPLGYTWSFPEGVLLSSLAGGAT